jgi:hypothetical protein
VRLLRCYDRRAMKDCYICGRPGAATRDHVIPESFFPTPKPSNLITLPAHYSCHNRLGEEYVRAILAGLAESKPAMRLNEGPAGRALRRNEPLKRDLRASMIRRIELRSPASPGGCRSSRRGTRPSTSWPSTSGAAPWLEPRIEIKSSPVHRTGLYAVQPIRA